MYVVAVNTDTGDMLKWTQLLYLVTWHGMQD